MRISIVSNGYTYTETIAPVSQTTSSTNKVEDTSKRPVSEEFETILKEIQSQLNTKIASVKGASLDGESNAVSAASVQKTTYPPYTGKIPSVIGNIISSEKRYASRTTAYDYESIAPAEYQDIFKRASETYNIDQKLLELIGYHESRFIPDEVSSSGAVGIMQLMPGTAQSHGVTDSYDPEQNIMGGARLLSELYDAYGGDLDLMISGYSAGMGAVRRAGGVPQVEATTNYISWIRERY